MTDYTKLVEALRYCKMESLCGQCQLYETNDCLNVLHDDAADAIEKLVALYEKAEIDATNLTGKLAQAEAQLPKLGEWQKAKPKGVVTYSNGYAECSHCHETIWLGWGMNFCPHCGTQNKIIDPDDYDGEKMTEVQE